MNYYSEFYQSMTTWFREKNYFVPLSFLITFLALAQNQNGFAQQSNSLPVEVKRTIDDLIQKGDESEKANDFNQASFFYHQAGNTYWTNGFIPDAIELFKKSLSMGERISNLNGIAVLNTKIGLLYTEIKDYESSLTYFTKSLEIARRMDRKQDLISSLLNAANSYTELERYNESIPFLTEAETLAKDIADTKLLRNCYSLMTRVYDKVGDREKSTQYFNLFAAITKRIQQDEMARKESEARLMVDKANSKVLEVESVKEATEQELKEKSQELYKNQINLSKVEQISKEQQMQIDLLNKENELHQAEIRQQQLMRNVYLGIIVAVLMISGLTLYGYSRIKRANILLHTKNIEISRQKDEIEKQAEELRELNALKDKLFSIIAHDLRSPLFSLITMLTMVKDGNFSAEEEKYIFNELSKNVEYNTELLENLLNWSSSQMKGNAINPIVFGIHELTANKIKLYEEAAHQKGIKLINSTNHNTEVFADKDMIELVLRNLITNAIKFSNHGDNITITSTSGGDSVQVCVADNGLGMPQETIEKLFGKHVFSTRGTLNEKGTGLGLILCRDFVHINGGEIWVESTESSGSKFFFTIPSKRS
jgi:signal transduction histidine kinase